MCRKVIEAEVRYAVRYEYAQTAVDVIARRCRLSFLNAQAALRALPRVIEIMAEDLNWSRSRQRAEVERATKFLASMGLPPGMEPPSLNTHSFMEKFWALLGFTAQVQGEVGTLKAVQEMVYSRAKFEAGEITTLHDAFAVRVQQYPAVEGETHLGREDVISLIRTLKGYEGVSQKDYEYVLTETGFADKSGFDLEEFVEVRNSRIGQCRSR
jgi:glycerol-3-phosphate dehydrogenase